MKKQFYIIILILLLLSNIPSFVYGTSNLERYIITFQNEIDEAVLQQYANNIDSRINSINTIVVDLPQNFASTLRYDQRVASVEKDTKVAISNVVQTNWGIDHIKVQNLWSQSVTGKGVKVAVIDTGASPHPNIVVKEGISTVPYTNSYVDDQGHGTHTASIIAGKNVDGRVMGVAPDVELYVIKALDTEGFGNLSDVIAGIEWAIEKEVDIINFSLGSDMTSSSFEAILDLAYEKDILLVASTGNEGTINGTEEIVQYPAKYPTVIAVGATDNENTRADFSATGSEVELAAPGVNIYGAYYQGGYALMSGTSMAAPFVTGTLALLKQAFPTKTNIELRQMLHEFAMDLGDIGKDPWYGYGLLQIPDMLYLQSSTPTEPSNLAATVQYELNIPTVTLNWNNADHVNPIKAYNIYRNEFLYEQISGELHSFVDTVPIPGQYIYNVSAVSTNDIESAYSNPVAVTADSILLNSVSPESYFTDINADHWAAKHIYYLVNEQIIKGYDDGTYKDNNKVTRGQVAIMIGLALGLDGTKRDTVFTDISKDHYASGYIQSIYEAGIIRGYTDGSYRAHEPITRAHIAIMLDNAYKLKEVPIAPFSDVTENTPGFASINKLAFYNIAKGKGNGTYKPFEHTSRAQFSVLMTNMLLHSKANLQ